MSCRRYLVIGFLIVLGLLAYLLWPKGTSPEKEAQGNEGGGVTGNSGGRSGTKPKRDPLLRAILGSKIEFYGQVLDLEDRPVAGATIRYGALDASGFAKVWDEGVPKVVLTADEEGRFSIRAKGGSLTVYTSKEGYYKLVGQSSGDFGYGFSGGQKPSSDPENPVVFRLREKGETEPLFFYDRITRNNRWIEVHNGKSIHWNLSTGKPGASPNGILVFQENNKPPRRDDNYDPRKYEWAFTLKVPGGGLVERRGGRFDFTAPEEGYQEEVHFGMKEDDENWKHILEREYFVKFPNGNYARIWISNSTNAFRYKSHLNPSGSRNLEYDPEKRIRPGR